MVIETIFPLEILTQTFTFHCSIRKQFSKNHSISKLIFRFCGYIPLHCSPTSIFCAFWFRFISLVISDKTKRLIISAIKSFDSLIYPYLFLPQKTEFIGSSIQNYLSSLSALNRIPRKFSISIQASHHPPNFLLFEMKCIQQYSLWYTYKYNSWRKERFQMW